MTTMSAIAIAAIVMLCGVAPSSAQSAPPATTSHIFPGDVIRLDIWREPDLSGSWVVSPEGVVVFPKLGPRTVTGQTVEVFRDALLADYAKYLINESIQIHIQRKVQILGAVREPGVFNLDPTMTVSDAIALAGGVLPDGRMDRVQLRRNNDVVQVLLHGRTPLADSPIRSGDQLYVPERSYFSRNAGIMAALISGSIGLILALTAR